MNFYSTTSGGETVREYTFNRDAREVYQHFLQTAQELTQDKNRLPPWAMDFLVLPTTTAAGVGLEFVLALRPLLDIVYLGRMEFTEMRAGECQGRLHLARAIARDTQATQVERWGGGVLIAIWQAAIETARAAPPLTEPSLPKKSTQGKPKDKAIYYKKIKPIVHLAVIEIARQIGKAPKTVQKIIDLAEQENW